MGKGSREAVIKALNYKEFTMYAIKKGSLYVRDMEKGGESSYTSNPAMAKTYATLEEAQKNLCPENEHIVKFHFSHEEWAV